MDILGYIIDMLLLVSRYYVYKIVECICMGGTYLCIRNSNKSHGTVKPTILRVKIFEAELFFLQKVFMMVMQVTNNACLKY